MALTGSLHNQICYATSLDAANTYFASIPVSINVLSDGTVAKAGYFFIAGQWKFKSSVFASNGAETVLFSTVQNTDFFPACDPLESFNDGVIIGGGLLLAVLTAVIYGIISKAR